MEIINHPFWQYVDKSVVLASFTFFISVYGLGYALGYKNYATRVFIGTSTS